MKIELSDQEVKLLVEGLAMKRNFIETGNPVLGSQDLKNMKRDREIKSLSIEQMKLIIQLHELSEKLNHLIVNDNEW